MYSAARDSTESGAVSVVGGSGCHRLSEAVDSGVQIPGYPVRPARVCSAAEVGEVSGAVGVVVGGGGLPEQVDGVLQIRWLAGPLEPGPQMAPRSDSLAGREGWSLGAASAALLSRSTAASRRSRRPVRSSRRDRRCSLDHAPFRRLSLPSRLAFDPPHRLVNQLPPSRVPRGRQATRGRGTDDQ